MPRELHVEQEQISGDVAGMVQVFCSEFVLPHLHHFMECCQLELVKPMKHHFSGNPISPTGPQDLPPPDDPMSSHLQCSALLLDVFSTAAENASSVKSKVLQDAGRVSALARNTPQTPSKQTLRKRRPADAFLLSKVKQDQEPKPVVVSPADSERILPPLISIGLSSDAVLDRLKMQDQTLLRLHHLLGTMHSSRWESVLASREWDLRPNQASALATALLKDVQGSPGYTITVAKVCVCMSGNMTLQVFHASKKSSCRPLQSPMQRRPRVMLSKEAHPTLTLQQREKSQSFWADLWNAWSELNNGTVKIAANNHKSVQHVQQEFYLTGPLHHKCTKVSAWNAFFWKKSQEPRVSDGDATGRSTLPECVREFRLQYQELSSDEKNNLIKEFKQHKEVKQTGYHISACSKVNDITQTLKRVENELNGLRCHTGAETLLFLTRGTTDLSLNGTSFATVGVDEFMKSVMGIDNQDFLLKMEGFPIQGIKGSAKNHNQRISHVCGAIHDIITRKLRIVSIPCLPNCGSYIPTGEKTGDHSAKMQWANYFCNVIIVALNSIAQLEQLLQGWEDGSIKWESISEDELPGVREALTASGHHVERTHHTRSDKGKKHQ
ncbi:hypothetical protein JVT61DRAFT_10380 [Boletus reticuloceps]|uniref:Uncharacterized protein n=1 Tax=Boletus reticuloceps TaxID=495285 RepID=A0A8I2YZ61_9AGAM|nr:hypothetical protein JVT61DRAFT_10380 [Boletus reticuloceps]